MLDAQLHESIRQKAIEAYASMGYTIIDKTVDGIAFFVKNRLLTGGKTRPVHIFITDASIGYSQIKNVAYALHPATRLCMATVDESGDFDLHLLGISAYRPSSAKRTEGDDGFDGSRTPIHPDGTARLPVPEPFLNACITDLESQGYYCDLANDSRFDLLVNRYGKAQRHYVAPLRIAILEGGYDRAFFKDAAVELPENGFIYGYYKNTRNKWEHFLSPCECYR